MPLLVSAKPKLYPTGLKNSELKAHEQVIQEYQTELSDSMYEILLTCSPDVQLINQQPDLTPSLRSPLLDFLFKVAKRTKVTSGIFYKAARLMDRYCSKRVVLKDQAQLVAGASLWVAAKINGGCNHIINSTSIPSGGRFLGPTIRSRIPRLTELVQLCGPACGYDEGMFVQMERHILDTLNWDLCESSIYNWLYSVQDYQCLCSTPNNIDDLKIVTIKNFLIENSLYSLDLVAVHPAELALVIKKILATLILNDDQYFKINLDYLPKILSNNNVEQSKETGNSVAKLMNKFTDFNMSLANKLLLVVANSTPTILSAYTSNTEHPELNEIITKVHKVAISHIMALQEENKQQQQQQQQQEHKSPSQQTHPNECSPATSTSSSSSASSSNSTDVDSMMSDINNINNVPSRAGRSYSSTTSISTASSTTNNHEYKYQQPKSQIQRTKNKKPQKQQRQSAAYVEQERFLEIIDQQQKYIEQDQYMNDDEQHQFIEQEDQYMESDQYPSQQQYTGHRNQQKQYIAQSQPQYMNPQYAEENNAKGLHDNIQQNDQRSAGIDNINSHHVAGPAVAVGGGITVGVAGYIKRM